MPRKRPIPHSPLPEPVQEPDKTPTSPIPIVGIGASAGGLEAFEQFFRLAPVNSGIAYILVPHLDPDHASMLAEILGRVTKMPVLEAQDQALVMPDHVYIIPPNREMAIFHQRIELTIPDASLGIRMKIDLFFRSLAEEQGDKAIGIVLSGTGTDGTLGLRAIQGGGGITFVQDPKTAKYDGMPRSVIHSGYATYVLPVEQMPDQIITRVKDLFGEWSHRPIISDQSGDSQKKGIITRILRIIRSRTGHDFSQYKKSTIHRRIDRRMAIHVIEDYDVYARYLEGHPDEVKTLFRELLINVTNFFRDPEAFDTLEKVLPEVIRQKRESDTIRVWVPGCSTGEEAYSLAIIIREVLDDLGKDVKVQIYSTDLAEDVISIARQGLYTPNISADVSPDRLKKFFIREEHGFRVKKDIREMVIFATQNVIQDPPFTKLDLLSCRNLLIYLEAEIQTKLILAFHYSLKPGGILFLSPSESIGTNPDIFKPINRKWKIYEAAGTRLGSQLMMATPVPWNESHPAIPASDLPLENPLERNIVELTRRALLQVYAPPSVVTDEHGNLLYVHGDTGKFLRPAPGQMTSSVLEMAREGLQLDLRTAVFTARTQNKTVFYRNLQVKTNGGYEGVDLEVRPILLSDSMKGGLIISFLMTDPQELQEGSRQKRKSRRREEKPGRVEELQQELQYTKENLQATVEEMQAANEELKSTNEELQSINEELQSTNEELETSKEELQSVNEEMMTVNAELQIKIEQHAGMQNDMKNLLSSTGIGTIFLTIDLAIRRFTPEATKIYNLVASDVGRPLSDLKSMIVQDELVEHARVVLDTLHMQEKEVITVDNSRFLVRILPYRTLENVIDGVVLTFIDISSRKAAEEDAIQAREYAEGIVNTVREPLLVLDQNLSVISANRSFYRVFQISPEETCGMNLIELNELQWDVSSLLLLLHKVLSEGTSFEDAPITIDFHEAGVKKFILNARRLWDKNKEPNLILLAMEEISGKDII